MIHFSRGSKVRIRIIVLVLAIVAALTVSMFGGMVGDVVTRFYFSDLSVYRDKCTPPTSATTSD